MQGAELGRRDLRVSVLGGQASTSSANIERKK